MGDESDRPAVLHGRAATSDALGCPAGGAEWRESAAPHRSPARKLDPFGAVLRGIEVAIAGVRSTLTRTAPAEDTMTPDEAAALLGISSETTIENWLIRGFRHPEGTNLLYRADVLAAKNESDAGAERRRQRVISVRRAAATAEFK